MSTLTPDRATASVRRRGLDGPADAAGGGAALFRAAARRLRQGPVPGRIPRGDPLPLSPVACVPARGRGERRRGGAGLHPVAHRPRGHRPAGRYSAIGDRRPRRARRAGHDRADRVRRPGILAAGLLPDHGGDRRPLRVDGGVRQRPSLDRHPRAGPLRHARAEGAMAPGPDPRREAGRLRPDRGAGRLRRVERPDDGHPERRRPDLRAQRDQAVHHQRGDRRRPDRDGPHPRSRRAASRRSPPSSSRPTCPGFEVVEPRMAKCGIRGTATAKLAFHDMPVPAANVLGPVGKGLKVGADGARLRPHDLRRELHRDGQVLPGRRHPARRAARAVRPAPGGSRAGPEEARLPGRDRLRDGGHDLRDRRADRPRHRGLHARDGHPQGLLDRGSLAGRLRDAPGPRRPGLLHRRALRADDARRADQHDRRGGQRGACSPSSPWWACATSDWG